MCGLTPAAARIGLPTRYVMNTRERIEIGARQAQLEITQRVHPYLPLRLQILPLEGLLPPYL